MLTGEIRSQIDLIWNTFWTGGISNPLEVIEQITYALPLKSQRVRPASPNASDVDDNLAGCGQHTTATHQVVIESQRW